MNKEISNMKMSDLVGKHKRKECFEKVYGEPPIVHGAFTYRCEDCGNEWRMWLEVGVEGKDKIMPSPFTIGCECGGWAEHIDWHKDIRFSEHGHRPISIGMKFFVLDHEYGCGKPSIYMGEKK